MSQSDGCVYLTQHTSFLMYEPIVQRLIKNRGQGSTCILTQTNEEAVTLVALLRKHGLNSKLIQSMDGFRFWNMAEVRMFLKYIEQDTHTPLITDDVWENAKLQTFNQYANSTSLHYLQQCIQLFEKTNKTKYLTDFKEYLFESSVEDYCDITEADVVVSTIHKSKGREFDDVYMLVSNSYIKNDQNMRSLYVAMTRAKKRLFIHTNTTLFDKIKVDKYVVDNNLYKMPEEIVLQLSHKDVNLGFFKDKKNKILKLISGDKLRFENNYLFEMQKNTPICQLSKKSQTDLCKWIGNGYYVSNASIRFIVAWKPKDAPKEEQDTAVILADLHLVKTNN